VNGTSYARKMNNKPMKFDDVKIFAGDPWYKRTDGKIRNLDVKSL